jgi:hypothetical protein
MANSEHLRILETGIPTWNKWREDAKPLRPDLSGADLRNKILNHADMHEADLHNTNLSSGSLMFAIAIDVDVASGPSVPAQSGA